MRVVQSALSQNFAAVLGPPLTLTIANVKGHRLAKNILIFLFPLYFCYLI